MKPLLKTLLLTACTAMLTACSSSTADHIVDPNDMIRHITFDCSPWQVDKTPMTRGQLIADGQAMTDLVVIDCDQDGQVLSTLRQADNTAADFGSPVLPLTYGTHLLHFTASRGSDLTVSPDGKTLSWSKARDTFHTSLQVEVTRSSGDAVSVALTRAVSKLKVCITDAVPASATELRITLSRASDSMSSITGFGQMGSVTRTFSCAADVGSVVSAWAVFTSCPSADEWQTDVTMQYVASDGTVLYSRTATAVDMLQNRETRLTGSMVNAAGQFTITLSDTWLDDLAIDF